MYKTDFTIKIKHDDYARYFILLQKIVSSFIQDYRKITEEFGNDDTMSVITKLLFRQFSNNMSYSLLDCSEYKKGVTLSFSENDILIEIVNLYREIKHPSFCYYIDQDYELIIEKLLN